MNDYACSKETLVREVDDVLNRLFPICRSITGNGTRDTLAILQQVTDFDIIEIPSGTKCYDWTVPDEWNINDAYVEILGGKKVIDFNDSNLHVVNYSAPINEILSFKELEKHLHTLPQIPDAIPYRTTYYQRNWGFCLSHSDFLKMNKDCSYRVFIDSALSPGSLTFGEKVIEGDSGHTFLISTYCCHPSLANDNLSGQVLWTFLMRELKKRKTRHSYRFIIAPETIGAIAYLHRNEQVMKQLSGGFVITTVAGPGKFGYKGTFLRDHLIDRAVYLTFDELSIPYISYPFDVIGSDESQYSAPYFRIPVGTICKDKYYEYDYYHTSLDNLNFISAEYLVDTLLLYLAAVEKLEMNVTYRSLCPYCEPMLGKRGLYPQIGGHIRQKAANGEPNHAVSRFTDQHSLMYANEMDVIGWLMFYSDGKTSLLDIAERTKFPLKQIFDVADTLTKNGLLELVI